jgi:DNA processing protein
MKKWNSWKIEEILKKDFPEQLKKIKNAPEKLYYRGNWDNKIFAKSLAIVGSRRITRYGHMVVEKFMPELVANKLTIISGFMYGVDTQAHTKCLEFGGKTVAVLGGGLDVLTPVENEELYSNILNNGGVMISEYEADFKPTLWSFPQRNRIVSGLATKGVLVVEAGMKSGSLVTARIAREQGKSIYVIPGPIDSSSSQGTNWLIREGWGKMVTEVSQITQKKSTMIQEDLFDDNLPKEQKEILEHLKQEPSTVDELARVLKKEAAEIGLTISLMSLSDLVEEENGKIYFINGRKSK